jgi:hypothetical protein
MSSWWWCLTHQEAEPGAGCANMSRLGPYESREQATAAPERTRARTEQQDAADEAEDGWGSAKR